MKVHSPHQSDTDIYRDSYQQESSRLPNPTIATDRFVRIEQLELYPGSSDQAKSYTLLGQSLRQAHNLGANCVYIEPETTLIRIRFRVGGVLHEERFDNGDFVFDVDSIIRRFGGSANDDNPGTRGILVLEDQKYELILLPLACNTHQTLAISLYSSPNFPPTLDELQMPFATLKGLRTLLTYSTGTLLLTGQIGSRKKETLIAIAQELNSPESKIISVENVINHTIPRVSQILFKNFKPQNLTEIIINQMPDIVCLDRTEHNFIYQSLIESVGISAKLIASINAVTPILAIQHLLSTGVNPGVISQSFRAILHQHTVSKVCEKCKNIHKITPPETSWIKQNFPTTKYIPGTLTLGEGCSHCSYSGYSGEHSVYEFIKINNEMVIAIKNNDMLALTTAFMLRENFQTLKSRAFNLACKGIIPLSQAMRIV